MHPVFTQLLAQPANVPPHLMTRIDEVWNKTIDEVAVLLSKQEYPGPDDNYRKLSVVVINIRNYRYNLYLFMKSKILYMLSPDLRNFVDIVLLCHEFKLYNGVFSKCSD